MFVGDARKLTPPIRINHIGRRPEIDGLRAVAVVGVMLYHAGFAAFRGGFLGVDVFFVISGYLITGIVAAEHADGAFSLVGFYERRARRLLPALFVVLAVCFVLAWAWLFPSEIVLFGDSVVSVALFFSNLFFLAHMNYFAVGVADWPLIHTWSLGVEEQFYLIYPLLLIALLRAGRRNAVSAVALGSAASLGLAQWASATHPEFDFFALPTRAWELGAGALVALAPQRRLAAVVPTRALAALGLLAICASALVFDEATPMPGLWSLPSVGGAVLVLAFAQSGEGAGRLLAAAPLVGIGWLSYSAYLWHQPLLAFARIRFDVMGGGARALGVLALAFALAYLSWRFFEQPFRDRSRVSRTIVFALAAAATVGFVIAGRVVSIERGYPSRFPVAAAFIKRWAADYPPRMDACFGWGDSNAFIAPEKSCVYGASPAPQIALWGDSHAAVLAGALGAALTQAGASMRQFSFTNCPPLVGVRLSLARYSRCAEFDDDVLNYLAAHREIATIILFARWPMYFDGDRWDNGDGYLDAGAGLTASAAVAHGGDRVAELGAAMRRSLLKLRALGKRVVLVEPAPEIGWRVPERIAERNFRGEGSSARPVSIASALWRARTRHFREQLAPLDGDPGLLRVDADAVFCDGVAAGRCVAEADGVPLYIDGNHLNSLGAAWLAHETAAAMKKAGWLP